MIVYDRHIVLDMSHMLYRQQVHVRYTFHLLAGIAGMLHFRLHVDFLGVCKPHFKGLCNKSTCVCCRCFARPHCDIGKTANRQFVIEKNCDLNEYTLEATESFKMSSQHTLHIYHLYSRSSVTGSLVSLVSPLSLSSFLAHLYCVTLQHTVTFFILCLPG